MRRGAGSGLDGRSQARCSTTEGDARSTTERRRLGPAVALLLLLAGLGAGCSSDPDEEYCEQLREEQSQLNELAGDAEKPGTDVLTPTLESLQRLREVAPDVLNDEYSTVVYAWENLVEAVDEAGVDPGDFRPGKTPEGIDRATARQLAATAAELGAPRITQATAGIEDHAAQVCDVDLRD